MVKARELFADNKEFIMVPSKLRPDSFAALNVMPHLVTDIFMMEFKQMVDSFRYYNCTGHETGRGVKFYIKTA